MSKSDQHSKVTLEDLLRLKRAERPSPEFWSKFEHELRQKQLTALVQKRRWWHEFPVSFSRRIYVPAGAAAIIAFTVLSVRYSVPGRIAQMPNPTPRLASETSKAEKLDRAKAVEVVQSPVAQREVLIAQPSNPPLDGASVGEQVAAIPTNLTSGELGAPAARPVVANLSRLGQSEPDQMDSVLGSRLSVPTRVQSADVSRSEVASLTPISAGKYQLIARYVERSLSPAPAAPAVVRERLARRLGDDLGDSISRIGVVGSRVSLKF
jgi:hypothetical protein